MNRVCTCSKALCFHGSEVNAPTTRAGLNLETDLFRAQIHIERDGSGGIENARQLAEKEGWSVSKARRVLKAGEDSGRFYFDMGVNVWRWTPEFAAS